MNGPFVVAPGCLKDVKFILNGGLGTPVTARDQASVRRVLDLNGGCGEFAVWATRRWPNAWIDVVQPDHWKLYALQANLPPGARIIRPEEVPSINLADYDVLKIGYLDEYGRPIVLKHGDNILQYRSIPGWCSFEYLYRDMIAKAPAEGARFLEVGTAFGRSLAYLGVRAYTQNNNIALYAVDTWDWGTAWRLNIPECEDVDFVASHDSLFSAFHGCMARYAPGVKYLAAKMKSTEAAKYLEGYFDFIFIDDDHSYEGCKASIQTWLPRVKPGGVIAGDDYSDEEFPGIVLAVDEIFGCKAKITSGPSGWKHWSYTVPG